jgi:hypothetical protein
MEIEMRKLLQNPGFRFHLFAYVLVNAILIAVNLMHPHHLWFFWPLIGWGLGIAAHGYAVSKAQTRSARPFRPINR